MNPIEQLERLNGFDRPIEPRAEFADALLASCLAAVAPAPPRRLLAGRTRVQVALAFVLLALLLAAIATATYLVLRPRLDASPSAAPSELTVMKQAGGRITGPHVVLAKIDVVDSRGRLHTVWSCPNHTWCGTLTAIAWSANGRYLAITLDELGGRSGYVGLHVVDVRTGKDTQIGAPPIPHLEREQPSSVLDALVKSERAVIGCPFPHELAWSPDSKHLAYVCGDDFLGGGVRTSILVIRPDGSHRVRIPTGTLAAYWPAWAPDGKRIAFSAQPYSTAGLFTVRLDGSGRKLIARRASAPSWSPDGTTIAYASRCGVAFVRVRGTHPAPPCLRAPAQARATWSPDGTQLAIGTPKGVRLVRPGTDRTLTPVTGAGLYAVGRPAWAPVAAVRSLLEHRHPSGL